MKNIQKRRGELPEDTTVVLVLADPEDSWLQYNFNYPDPIIKLPRPTLPKEGQNGTSYPESYNINLALGYIKANHTQAKVIVHPVDVWPQKGLYKHTVYSLDNTDLVVSAMGHIGQMLSSSYFGTRLNQDMWPPLLKPDHPETLEYTWGQIVDRSKLRFFYVGGGTNWFSSHDHKEQVSFLRQ